MWISGKNCMARNEQGKFLWEVIEKVWCIDLADALRAAKRYGFTAKQAYPVIEQYNRAAARFNNNEV